MVSVCLSTFNGEKYIKEQLLSILSQLGHDDEVVLSDDSSTDKTLEIVESINDNRVRIIRNGMFGNPIYNFEYSLKLAKGDIIFLSDQDDIWSPDKVKNTIPYFNQYDMVVSNCTVVNEELNEIYSSFFKENESRVGLLHNLKKNGYLGCCMAFKRKVLKKALPFPEKIPMHDVWLGFVAELFYKPIFIEQKLIIYRRHQKNASTTAGKSRYTLSQKINFRWQLLKHLPRLFLR